MKIDKNTTEEQILSGVKRAKAALVEAAVEEAVSEYMNGEHLVSMAQNVASAEAVAHVAMQYLGVVRSFGEYEGVEATLAKVKFLAGVLARGADDSWSGRGNDSKRSSNDAVRAFVSEQLDALR